MKTLFSALLLLVTAAVAQAAAPEDFTVQSATGNGSFSLKEARGKYVALHFLLKTECPICQRYTQDVIKKAAILPTVQQVFLKPDTEAEIKEWSGKLSAEELGKYPIYRDPDARLAKAFGIPDDYAFHGQVVHYPALILIGPDGKEAFRYIGKSNKDRFSFEQLAEKVAELSKH